MDSSLGQAFEHARMGMTEGIPKARGNHRERRRHAIEKLILR